MSQWNRLSVRTYGFLAVFATLVMYALMSATGSSFADVDKDFDWKGKKRALKVCVSSTAGCPAGMVDSVKAAINLWNAKLVSWSLTFTTDCSEADVKIKCGAIKGLGSWSHTKGAYGSSEENTVTINKDGNWGWCNDKVELVSTIAHELGHCMRLNDVGGQDKCMRGTQGEAGHARGPTAADSLEASISDGNKPKDAKTTPPGGKKQTNYFGVLTPDHGTPPFDLFSATSVTLTAFRPTDLMISSTNIIGNDALEWQAFIGPGADATEALELTIEYPSSTVTRQAYLSVAPTFWDELWEPVAVAPPDTIVPSDTSLVALYADQSIHPAGLESMHFLWNIDGDPEKFLKEPVTSVTLPVGTHVIHLKAQDLFGKESVDSFTVIVSPTVAVTFAGFDVAFVDRAVRLQWLLGDVSYSMKGFNLYRSTEEDVLFKKINPALIAPDEREFVDDDVRPGGTYWYRVGALDRDGEWFSRTVSIRIPETGIIVRQNYPNPFNPSTTISFYLPSAQHVEIGIYDVQGKRVRTLLDRNFSAGEQETTWDGRDDHGNPMSSGVYYYRLKAGDTRITKKLVLLK